MSKNRQGREKRSGASQAGAAAETAALGSRRTIRFGDWHALGLIAIVAILMAYWTWGTWPDVLIDFGVERYIPWRLAEGEVLYRDISFHNGPLSQYFNSVCFRVFGSSLRTLVFCNLAILGGLIGLMYYMLRQLGNVAAATAGCLTFVLLFGFAQFSETGNYNYVCPYAHEMTHGLLLSLGALAVAWPRRVSGVEEEKSGSGGASCVSAGRVFVAGLLVGLVFLTKAEVFVAAVVATMAAILLQLVFQRRGWSCAIWRLVGFVAGLAIPPATAFGLLALAMPARQALVGVLGSWPVAVRSDMRGLAFYAAGQGLYHPWENVLAMFRAVGLYCVVLVPAGIIGLGMRRPGQHRAVVATVLLVATIVLFWLARSEIDWLGIARPLPLLLVVAMGWLGVGFWRHRREPVAQGRFAIEASLVIFAVVLLAKMILNARIIHYGFVLAMPGTMVLIVAAIDWIPAAIERRGGYGMAFAAGAAGLLTVTSLVYLGVQSYWIVQKYECVGTGSDAFLADSRGAFVSGVVEQIRLRSSPGTTLAVLPEGVMINCLAGLRNPTSHINFMPVELMLFGEEAIAESFESHPPDLIALVHKDTSELGVRFFGRDYGRRLAGWIGEHYHPCCQLGEMPLTSDKFGILLMERNGPVAAAKK